MCGNFENGDRPDVLEGTTERKKVGCGKHLYITSNANEDGELTELFLRLGKSGGCINSFSEGLYRMISLALSSGAEPREVAEELKGIRCPDPSYNKDKDEMTFSCCDAISESIERAIDIDIEETKMQQVQPGQE